MCGICGALLLKPGVSIHRELLQKMADTLRHRGPDDEGYFLDEGLGFGHRRLSIIDVEGGKQPLSNEDGTVWITYNGEVYNFKSIKSIGFYSRKTQARLVHSQDLLIVSLKEPVELKRGDEIEVEFD